MNYHDYDKVDQLRGVKARLTIIAWGLIFIACLAVWGMVDTATHQAMSDHANSVAQCKSIEGAKWGGDACYYNGVKLNFKEGLDAPAED